MCDYSAETAITRAATVGDQLVSDFISNHGTIGLVEKSSEADVAVCLLPGAKLIVSGISVADQQAWGVGEVAVATFDQLVVDGAKPNSYYRDGVIFDGTTEHVSLQAFGPGVEFSVEFLPNQPLEEMATPTVQRELATV